MPLSRRVGTIHWSSVENLLDLKIWRDGFLVILFLFRSVPPPLSLILFTAASHPTFCPIKFSTIGFAHHISHQFGLEVAAQILEIKWRDQSAKRWISKRFCFPVYESLLQLSLPIKFFLFLVSSEHRQLCSLFFCSKCLAFMLRVRRTQWNSFVRNLLLFYYFFLLGIFQFLYDNRRCKLIERWKKIQKSILLCILIRKEIYFCLFIIK